MGVMLDHQGVSITEMARLYDVSLRTLRFYEDRGFLEPVRSGTARCYTPKDRVRLELILKGKRLGFTLTEIWKLIAAQPERAGSLDASDIAERLDRDELATQLAALERQRASLQAAIDELRSTMTTRLAS